MSDRETIIKGCKNWVNNHIDENLLLKYSSVVELLAILKEQETIKQKMWNALYAEEDKLEEQYAGTDKNDDWFFVYRPWLQRGFEIAIEVIAKQGGQ